jgi:rhomboid protease GluP
MKSRLGPATTFFIALNVAIFLYGFVDPTQENQLKQLGALYVPGLIKGEFWRLLIACFLHANALHIGMNMISLASLGAIAEPLYGSRRYALIYLAAGIVGFGLSAFSRLWSLDSLGVASLGASGAVFGVAGSLLGFLYSRLRSLNEFFAHPSVKQIGFNLIFLFVIGFMVNIDHFAHFGGLFGGAAFAILLGPERGWSLVSGAKRAGAWALSLALVGVTAYTLYPVKSPGWEYVYVTAKLNETTLRAATEHDAGRFEEALRAADEAFAISDKVGPQRAFLLMVKASALMELERPEEARPVLEELSAMLRLNPNLSHEQLNLARVKEMQDRLPPR